jgi:hypothetical protein
VTSYYDAEVNCEVNWELIGCLIWKGREPFFSDFLQMQKNNKYETVYETISFLVSFLLTSSEKENSVSMKGKFSLRQRVQRMWIRQSINVCIWGLSFNIAENEKRLKLIHTRPLRLVSCTSLRVRYELILTSNLQDKFQSFSVAFC